ncbi:bacterio-opsin activator domain-containing protein [Halosolutus gelatinilyticus]|uniref:bacterio-opsin activator domain-containing protein n=1 Tax=Halosolutus gelatinilyticus TaxID=2931975 RepID=UPI001FF65C6C|nr:bacterio-opsin activator domain-containing protein [Halosolutus gelatinilyticus]
MTDDDTSDGASSSGTAFPLDTGRLVELVPHCAVYVLDRAGRVAVWSEAASRLTGYAESDVVGSHYERFFPEPAREADRPDQLLAEAASTGRIEMEEWRRRRDGTQFRSWEVLARIRDEEGTLTGYAVVAHDVTDEYTREADLRTENAFVESVLDAQPDIIYAFDVDRELLQWNDRFVTVTGYDPDELAEMGPLAFIAPEDRDRIEAAADRILADGGRCSLEADLLTNDGTRIPYEFNSAPISAPDGTVLGFTGVGRDVSERRARERERERLDRLNGVIRSIDDALIGAETRRDLETGIVDTFAADDAFVSAVIGTYDPTDGFGPRVGAGADATPPSGVLPPQSSAERPAVRAVERETVAVRRHLDEDPIEEWRAVAREHGFGSIAAVPIVAETRTLGVLGLYATDPDAFAEREQEILLEFGATIGHAIAAMEVRRLLYADAVVELELESSDPRDVCVALSREGDCRLSIDHVLPLTDDVFVYYLTASDVDADRFREVAASHSNVGELRPLDAAHSRWEIEVHGSTIAAFLTEYGARIRTKVVSDGVANIVIEASPETEIRELVDAIRSVYPETKLVSKRTVERPLEVGDDTGAADPDLTEKQRLALEAAYYGGYFEWPTRVSDAGEIADRLGIARQTFHQHLRVAVGKLVGTHLENSP